MHLLFDLTIPYNGLVALIRRVTMKKMYSDIFKLFFGLFLYSLGMVVGYQAHIGYAPWEAFHVGLSNVTGLSIGQAGILVGAIIMVFVVIKKEALGYGGILNMILIGLQFDLILSSGLVPISASFVQSLIYVFIAMIIISFATYFYISAAFGAGPRDALMVFLSRRFKISNGFARRILEIVVTFFGYLMGGQVWIGTLIFAFVTGVIMDFIFTKLKFDPKTIEHRLIRNSPAA